MDGGAWLATVHGFAKSRTRLSNFTSLHYLLSWAISLGMSTAFQIESLLPPPEKKKDTGFLSSQPALTWENITVNQTVDRFWVKIIVGEI